MTLCPCCNKPINLVQDLEPAARLPDEIAKMGESERRARCMLHSDACTIDWEDRNKTPRCFVRAVFPFVVTDRDRPFHWGIWVDIEELDFVEYARMTHREQGGEIVTVSEDQQWAVRIANELEQDLGLSTLNKPARLVWRPNNQRPSVYVHETDQPLFSLQIEGVALERTLQWTRRFHSMLAS